MKSDRYFDQLTVCDDDFEVTVKLLKMSFPGVVEHDLERLFASQFRDLPSLLSSSFTKLKSSNLVGSDLATFLKYLHVIVNIYNKSRIRDRDLIANIQDLNHYLHLKMRPMTEESLLLLTLNSSNHLIREEIMATGTANGVDIHPQQIVKAVLAVSATAFILVHNHPSGNPKPSERDIFYTRKLCEICRDLDITFHDHIIVGQDTITSMRREGII